MLHNFKIIEIQRNSLRVIKQKVKGTEIEFSNDKDLNRNKLPFYV